MIQVLDQVPGLLWAFDFDPTTAGGVPGAPINAFGIRTDDSSLWFHRGVGPTQWVEIGAGGGGGSTTQAFRYTVTGSEPDRSEIVITLPIPMASTNYAVMATCQGVAGINPVDVPVSSFATTHFTVIGTGAFVATDVIAFVVLPLTA